VLLAADILILTVVYDTQIEELATKHNVTKQHVEKLINTSTHYKKLCTLNLANTPVHMKANELNKGI
jgi:predicted negative regulator of RcsB-dependent stress response